MGCRTGGRELRGSEPFGGALGGALRAHGTVTWGNLLLEPGEYLTPKCFQGGKKNFMYIKCTKTTLSISDRAELVSFRFFPLSSTVSHR